MPVTLEENNRFREFVSRIAQEGGCFDFKPDQIIWHYTNGAGFLGILQSSHFYATQVAALNDANEIRHASDLFIKAVKHLITERASEQDVATFLNTLLKFANENTGSHNISKFFVTCFSGEEDDLTQWDRYGTPNGYAIGFSARGLQREPTRTLFRVVYDTEKQERAAKELAESTVKFYLEGLNQEREKDPELWTREFLAAWDEWVYKLAPLAKAFKWKAENEYRLVHELKPSEFPAVRFAQKATMLARYIALDTPIWVKRRSGLLPIAKIVVGPGSNYEPTRVSIKLLLDQMGYPEVPIEETTCSLRRP
jgi:hypothetical protein